MSDNIKSKGRGKELDIDSLLNEMIAANQDSELLNLYYLVLNKFNHSME